VSSAFVGVDLGGTKVAAAALSAPDGGQGSGRGDIGESVLRPTDLSSSDALVEQLVGLVQEVEPGGLRAVGVGVPSVVEFSTGRVVSSVNIPLADVPLRRVLGDRLGLPVFVDNDATVAALAEAHDEDLTLVARNLVMLTIGTGVGGGIVIGGRIYRGATGGAGELGHAIVGLQLEGQNPVPAPGGFPQIGSLEHVASGRALDRFAAETAELHPDSTLGRAGAAGSAPTGGDAVAAASAGDSDAEHAVEMWAQRVGIGVANAINTFDPDEVVIGGGASLAGELLLEPAIRVARGYVHPGLAGHARVRLARHGVRAGVLGAALLALHEYEQAAAASEGEAESADGVGAGGEGRRVLTEPTSPEVS
jgi:glucokinase